MSIAVRLFSMKYAARRCRTHNHFNIRQIVRAVVWSMSCSTDERGLVYLCLDLLTEFSEWVETIMIDRSVFVTNCSIAVTNGKNAASKASFGGHFVPQYRNIADNLPLSAPSKLKEEWLFGDQTQSQIEEEIQLTGLRSVALEVCTWGKF